MCLIVEVKAVEHIFVSLITNAIAQTETKIALYSHVPYTIQSYKKISYFLCLSPLLSAYTDAEHQLPLRVEKNLIVDLVVWETLQAHLPCWFSRLYTVFTHTDSNKTQQDAVYFELRQFTSTTQRLKGYSVARHEEVKKGSTLCRCLLTRGANNMATTTCVHFNCETEAHTSYLIHQLHKST